MKKTLGHHALMHDGEKFIDTWSKDLDTSDDALITEDLKIYHAIKDLKLAQLGEPALWNIAGRLGLVDLLKYFFEHNKSTAEYHSNYHAICVALNCYEGAWHQNLDSIGGLIDDGYAFLGTQVPKTMWGQPSYVGNPGSQVGQARDACR